MSTFELVGNSYYRKDIRYGGGQGIGDVARTFQAEDENRAIEKAKEIIQELKGTWGRKAGFSLELKEIRLVKKFSISESWT